MRGFSQQVYDAAVGIKPTARTHTTMRLYIQNSLQEELRKITPANGYMFDLSGEAGTDKDQVVRGDYRFENIEVEGNTLAMPRVGLLEKDEQRELQFQSSNDSPDLEWEYELAILGNALDDGFAYKGDAAAWLLADVQKCLALLQYRHAEAQNYFPRVNDEDDKLSGVITEFRFEPGVVRPAENRSALAYFWLEARFKVVMQPLNPYINQTI